MYYIPKVVDCTCALNEWVYPASGDLSKLTDATTQELPEYVRRFTQDAYLCVYTQPDAGKHMEIEDLIPSPSRSCKSCTVYGPIAREGG